MSAVSGLAVAISAACGSSEQGDDEPSDLVTETGNLQPPTPSASGSSSSPAEPGISVGSPTTPSDLAEGESLLEDEELGEDSGDGAASDFGEECARDSYLGERVDVNLYLLLDVSGSMAQPIGAQSEVTQWDAVRTALVGFVESEDTDGFNLALNYYPILSARSDCGPQGSCDSDVGCVTGVCDLRLAFLDIITPCNFDAQCELVAEDDAGNLYAEACLVPGRCSNLEFEPCFLDEQCGDGGACIFDESVVGLCPGQNSCTAADYVTPDVDRTELPEGAASVVESLLGRTPDPFAITPTQVALQGAYERVASWIAEDPNTPSFVVLATDGAPVGCTATEDEDPQPLALSAIEAGRDDGIETFVIGVVPDLSSFSEEDQQDLGPVFQEFEDTLDQMAELGGTQAPYNVTVDDTTAESFQQALSEIRGQVLACEYVIPEPDTGGVSFDRLNVELTLDGQNAVVPKVDGVADCIDGEDAWYYNTDESTQTPTTVVLCPATCENANAQQGASVDIVLGCETVRRVR